MPAVTSRPADVTSSPGPSAATSQPGAGGADLRGRSYQEGRDAVRPGGGGGLIPGSGDEALRLAQRSVTGGGVGATLDEGTTAYRDQDVEVCFDPGTRLQASLGGDGIHFNANPGILVKVRNAPDVRIRSIHWRFGDARFDAGVSADGFDVLGLIGRIGQWKVEQVLDQRLKPLLPGAVRQAGYSPQRDPDLTGTIGQLQRMFAFSSATPGVDGDMASRLSAPSASAHLGMPEEFAVDLGDSGLELRIAKGTPLDLEARGQGALTRPVIEALSLRAGARGIQVRPKTGAFQTFKELNLHGITIRRGGAFAFDYELGAESALEGMAALGQLLGLAMGQPVSGQVPQVRLDSIRAEIDAKLQAEVPPRFLELLGRYDGIVPGFSLRALFG